ncbi:hypothetical protein [Acidovorax sp.]|uniref:hypothetical protein n=1 Tax=Acidovorax sp. TaxID=1872122 RepID=UPI00391F24ED
MPPNDDMTETTSSALQLHDARPFFEKALVYGVQRGIIDAERLAALNADAPKGMVQIARYFGSEFLRPELERARDRIVNLISLHLLETTGADLEQSAVLLRDHSLLSRSKAGSDMLRRLIAMPESSNFGMAGFADADVPLLGLWSLRSHAQYRAELARRSRIAAAIDAALWMAEQYDLDLDTLQEAGADAEAVIRTALVLQVLAPRVSDWPHPGVFEKAVNAQRKQSLSADTAVMRLPAGLPGALREAVQAEYDTVRADLRKLLDPATALRPLMRPTSAFRSRYFLLDDPLAEVDDYHRSLDELDAGEELLQPASKTWTKTVQGNDDEHSLLTLFLCVAAGAPKKTLLTEKTAASLVRKLRKSGLDAALATGFIREHAPGARHADYIALWHSFVQDAQRTLLSDMDYQLHDALALLRRECSVAA